MVRNEPVDLILNILEKYLHFKVSSFLGRMWFRRIPIREVLIRRGISDSMECCCSNDDIQESFMHLFIFSSNLYQVLRLFL